MARRTEILTAAFSLGILGCGSVGDEPIPASSHDPLGIASGDGWSQIQEGVYVRHQGDAVTTFASGVAGARWVRARFVSPTERGKDDAIDGVFLSEERRRNLDSFLLTAASESVSKSGVSESSVGAMIVPEIDSNCDTSSRQHIVSAKAAWSSPFSLSGSASALAAAGMMPVFNAGFGTTGAVLATDVKPVTPGTAVDGSATLMVSGSAPRQDGGIDTAFAYLSRTGMRCYVPVVSPPDPCVRGSGDTLRPCGHL